MLFDGWRWRQELAAATASEGAEGGDDTPPAPPTGPVRKWWEGEGVAE